MARRRAPAAPARTGTGLPPELEVCWVEDWVSTWERPPPSWFDTRVNGRPVVELPAELASWAEITARRRWKAARAAWATELGLDPRELTAQYGTGRPRHRGPRPTDEGRTT